MNSHLSPQQLLAYLDGELSKREARQTKLHLHSCWTCRIAMNHLEVDIATILGAQNEVFSPALPPPTRSWLAFDTLLARNLPDDPDSLWGRLATHISRFFGPARILVTSSVLMALVIFSYSMFRSKPVSAKEVLRQVHIADARRPSIAKDQVLLERVHIRKNILRHGPPQLEEVDAWKSQTAIYWNKSDGDSAAGDLEARYKAHDVPMDLPLSAASVDCWGKAAGGNPTISQNGDDIDLTFAGLGDNTEDPIERVSLLIRPQSWQVKQMTLQFPDASFEVTEDDFSVLPVSAIPVELLAQLEPLTPPQMLVQHVAKPLSIPVAPSMHSRAVDLDGIELGVFATLHHLNADLGEPVTVTRSDREVRVGIWQLPADRQRELSAALVGKPGVRLQIANPIEVTTAGKALTETSLNPPLLNTPDLEDGEQRLLNFFGSTENEEAFARKALATSTTILAHLYALRNLQDEFPPQTEKALALDRRRQLSALVEDHCAAIATGLDDFRVQIVPLNAAFDISSSGTAANPDVGNWQNGSLDALEKAKIIDHLLRSLLTTSQTPVSPETALPQIQQNLSDLIAEARKLGIAAP